jgi:hypothetical protein
MSCDFDSFIFCSFVSLFKDEYKLSKGSVIELSRESNHVLKISSKFISLLLPFLFGGFEYVIYVIMLMEKRKAFKSQKDMLIIYNEWLCILYLSPGSTNLFFFTHFVHMFSIDTS